MSLVEFLTCKDPLFRNSVFNVQARLLAGGRFGASNHSRTCVVGPYMDEVRIVENACLAVSNAYFVGISDRFKLSLQSLFRKAGIVAPIKDVRLNKGPQRPCEICNNEQIAGALRRNTQLDQRVYDFVADSFGINT